MLLEAAGLQVLEVLWSHQVGLHQLCPRMLARSTLIPQEFNKHLQAFSVMQGV